ncbi:MAG: hypothetical protein R3336_01755 [Phycisphaeraceae bacterium]|nr:hypothetical protein [Phycisphaeraceae bacterium]
MSQKKTPDTRLTFGKHKGMSLRQCPIEYVRWVAENLRDSDLHEWALAADKTVEQRKGEPEGLGDLEAQADELLRQAGENPKKPNAD